MLIIRRIMFIIVLLALAFVFYRILNPEGADALLSKIKSTKIISSILNIDKQEDILDKDPTLTGNTFSGDFYTSTNLTGNFQKSGSIDNQNDSTKIEKNIFVNKIKGDLNYINSDYNFSITFPSLRSGYTIQEYTGKDIKSKFVFSLNQENYFILYVITNQYYRENKILEFEDTTYLSQDDNNTFVYQVISIQSNQINQISYIIKTFKLIQIQEENLIDNTIDITTGSQIDTGKQKNVYSDPNYLKQIFDSFVK